MEMLEMELIKKLQNTQAIQKQAYAELEDAINTRPVVGVMPGMSGGSAQFRGMNGSSNGQMMQQNGLDPLQAAMGNVSLGGGAQNISDGQQMQQEE